jgi:uncharacterized membrane protein YhaH (DUF805 family)
MNLAHLLFSFEGRIGRKEFWIWNVVYYAMLAIGSTLIAKITPTLALFLFPVLLVILLIPDLAVTAKRWHDRNKSNWFLLLNVPLILGRVFVPAAGESIPLDGPLAPFLSVAAVACGGWILVECGFMKGDEKANQYGEAYKG